MATLNSNTTQPIFILPKCITTFREDTVGGSHQIILTTIYAANMLAIIIFNLMLIVGICKTRKKNKKFTNSNKLFLILCTSDLLAGVVLMPLQIYFINLIPNVECMHTAVRAFWSAFPVVFSGTNILVITLGRYLMMVQNEFYHKRFSKKRLLVTIVVIEVTISLAWAFWYVFTTQSLDRENAAAFYIGMSCYQLCFLSFVVILNIMMVQHVKHSRKNTTLTNHDRAENILSRTVSLISLTLILCYIPGTVATGTAGFYSLYSKDRESVRKVTVALIYCFLPTQINSSVNAIIYLSRNTRIKSYYKSICCGEHQHSHIDDLHTNDSVASHKEILHKHGVKSTKKKQYHTYTVGQNSLADRLEKDLTTNTTV